VAARSAAVETNDACTVGEAESTIAVPMMNAATATTIKNQSPSRRLAKYDLFVFI
jgi:hypothetical protein